MYMLVSHTMYIVHVTYVVKEVLLSQDSSQIMGVVRKRMYVQVVPTRRKNVGGRICS